MPSADVAREVRSTLQALKSADLKDPRLGEVLSLASQMTQAMQSFFGSIDRSLHDELFYIADYIKQTRCEISNLRPNDLHADQIPGAGAELDAVVKHTATATNTIMAAAEDRRRRENILNGPALNGPEVAQDAIDAMFDGPEMAMSQDDLDALFA